MSDWESYRPNKGKWKRIVHRDLEEGNKWNKLKNKYPHIVLPSRAERIQNKINVDGLVPFFASNEAIAFQASGWIYVKIIRPTDMDTIPDDTIFEYKALKVGNTYDDIALFKRPLPVIVQPKADVPFVEDNSQEH